MKKYLTNFVSKMLGFTVLTFMAMIEPAFCQEPAVDNGLITYTLPGSPDQQIKLRLPADIRSGDRITGTVVEEPQKKAAEPGKASATLEGVVIEIDGKKTKVKDKIISFIVPAGLTSLPFLLKNAAGEVVDLGQIPVGVMTGFADGQPLAPVRFKPAPVCQPGQPITINGPFDGNLSNSRVVIGGQPCEIIAESPRMSYAEVPQSANSGPTNVTVNENNSISEHKTNVVILNLTADKVKLKRSEKATVKVTVSGLEGLETGTGCKIEVTNRTPSVIRIKDTEENKVTKTIPEKPSSEYKFTFQVVGITQGNYIIDGNLNCPINANPNAWQALAAESPELKKWREKLREALGKRLKEQGFTKNEVNDILSDLKGGYWGIIKNLLRLYKMKTAIDKAYEDAGPKPD